MDASNNSRRSSTSVTKHHTTTTDDTSNNNNNNNNNNTIELTSFRLEDHSEVKSLIDNGHRPQPHRTQECSVDDGHGVGPAGTASLPQVATNIIISFVGAGILGIPDAFRQAGWVLGSFTLLTISALNVYAMLLLPQVKRALLLQELDHPCSTYGEIGRCILGLNGERLVNICLGISQAGFATAYIIFIAANLYSICRIPRFVTCLLCIPGLAGLVQFRDMKQLSVFSLLANCANFAAMSAVLFQDFESFTAGVDPDSPVVADPVAKVDWNGFLYVIAITIYSMEGVGLILSLESSCKEPERFPWLLRMMLVCISSFMVFFGTAGYMAFGKETVAPITLNLVDHFWSATFVKCGLCLGLYLTYPVMMYPIWSISESLSEAIRSEDYVRIGFRSSLVVLSALIAYGVPDFGKFLSLVGSSICTILGFILPCFFHVQVLGAQSPKWQVALNWSLIVGATLFGFQGTYNSFVALFNGELEAGD